jgi:Fic family protein
MTEHYDLRKMGVDKTITYSQPVENTSKFYTADDVAAILGVSKCTAYRKIKRLNTELSAKGYIIVPGKISKRYFCEKAYF